MNDLTPDERLRQSSLSGVQRYDEALDDLREAIRTKARELGLFVPACDCNNPRIGRHDICKNCFDKD